MPLKMRSTAFEHLEAIPARFTCEGRDVSPPLDWSDPPEGTVSFALTVDDPDAPDPRAPKMTWVHWVLYNIPKGVHSLSEGTRDFGGGLSGQNDWKRTGYGGPCPPIGKHRYFFKLYALDAVLHDLATPTKASLEKAMKGHILGSAQLIGTYEKTR